ncbi:hypothetical protein OHA77_32710 [Streptosporangium sp. NBC_01639]|nr:hypothetical protein OHA77_32710 [Streptosporangium sp. NBC_01639]
MFSTGNPRIVKAVRRTRTENSAPRPPYKPDHRTSLTTPLA